jgi:hypothetical protein
MIHQMSLLLVHRYSVESLTYIRKCMHDSRRYVVDINILGQTHTPPTYACADLPADAILFVQDTRNRQIFSIPKY